MRRPEVGAGREREAAPGLGPAGPGPTEEYCHRGDGGKGWPGPRHTGDLSLKVGMRGVGGTGQRPCRPRLVKVKAS